MVFLECATPPYFQLVFRYITACNKFYQASPHFSTADDKHCSEAWGRANHQSEDSVVYELAPPVYSAQDRVCWKVRVREAVLERRQVERNWKERVCGISDHQPDNAGVLCAVASCQQTILAWYVLTGGSVSTASSHCFPLSPATHQEQCIPGMCVMSVGR